MKQGVNKSICTAIAYAVMALSLGACESKEDKSAEDLKAIRSMMEADKAKEEKSIADLKEMAKKQRESR